MFSTYGQRTSKNRNQMRIQNSKFNITSKGNRRGSYVDLNFRPAWPTEGTDDLGEIVMAKISTLRDVRCVVARHYKDKIYYRVIDDENDLVYGAQITRSSKLPLTLGALTDYLLGAWDLFEVLKHNFAKKKGYPPDNVLAFFETSSDFYPEFGKLIKERVEEWLKQRESTKPRRNCSLISSLARQLSMNL